jgi:hypothetical protein
MTWSLLGMRFTGCLMRRLPADENDNPALSGPSQNHDMGNALPRNDYMRLLYEQAAREQRQLAARVRAARGDGTLIADFEHRAEKLERLARPVAVSD